MFHSFLFRDIDWVNQAKIFPGETFDMSKSSPFGRTQSQEMIEKWSGQQDFSKQLSLLKDLYDAKLFFIDQKLKDLLYLYNSKELGESTIVILTGDHGEAFMEHGQMGHGDSVFDEAHRFPLFIKFPGQRDSHRINTQVHLGAFKDLWENVMDGFSTQENAVSAMTSSALNKKIVLRNCKGDLLAFRKNNETKFILDARNNRKHLFNLVLDPKEKRDLFSIQKTQAEELENELLSSDLKFRSQLHTNCHSF